MASDRSIRSANAARKLFASYVSGELAGAITRALRCGSIGCSPALGRAQNPIAPCRIPIVFGRVPAALRGPVVHKFFKLSAAVCLGKTVRSSKFRAFGRRHPLGWQAGGALLRALPLFFLCFCLLFSVFCLWGRF